MKLLKKKTKAKIKAKEQKIWVVKFRDDEVKEFNVFLKHEGLPLIKSESDLKLLIYKGVYPE